MSAVVQIFSCRRCNRGGFRSLAGADGKAHCPWCGDRVEACGSPLPGLADEPTPIPTARPETLSDAALRDRLTEVERRCQQAESELRRELEKKQEIKRAVTVEMAQLNAQLTESKSQLDRKENDYLCALLETKGLKDDVTKERQRADDMAAARGSLDTMLNSVHSLETDLEAARKSARELQEARDAAVRDTQSAKSELAQAKEAAAAEAADLKKKLAAAESRLHSQKGSADELKALKTKHEGYRGRMEKDHAALTEKAKSLQADLEKRDHRIKDLQLLIKTLGERLNDLSGRHLGVP
jgi:chromosome segregation ATPase